MKRNRLFSVLFALALLVSAGLGISPSYAQGGLTHEALLAQIPTLANFAQQAQQTFVGEVEGSYAYISFVVQDNLAVIYVCDSIGVSAWFKAEVVDGAINVTGDKNGIQIIANITAEGVKGSITLATDDDGKPSVGHNFTTAPAVPGKTGLARFATEDEVSGWIVTDHGIRGIKKFLTCRAFGRVIKSLRESMNSATDPDVKNELAGQIIDLNVQAGLAGCDRT